MNEKGLKIRFGREHLASNRYRLIELPDDHCVNAIKSGDYEIGIRGLEEDEAIMIVDDKSYRLRELCTSNTSLLVNGESGIVVGQTSSILEAAPIKGLTERLAKVLRQCPYEGYHEMTDADHLSLLAVDYLPGLIQASPKELNDGLKRNGAIFINGHYRILGPSYICKFFELFFRTAVLEDWAYAAEEMGSPLSKNVVIDRILDEYAEDFGPCQEEKPILIHLINLFGTQVEGSEDSFYLSEWKVCRFFAERLLLSKSGWVWSEFRKCWERLVGDFQPSLKMLLGLALLDANPATNECEEEDWKIRGFNAKDLPVAPKERFKMLFQTRSRWFFDDFLPYLPDADNEQEPPAAQPLSVEMQGLLLKHVRYSKDGTGRQVVTPILPV